jgi:hypothetical protein
MPTNSILDCSLSFGPDQEVTVRKTPTGLVLEELTDSGSFIHRALTVKEYNSAKIRLRTDSPIDSGTLTYKDGQWLYDLGGAVGYASCNSAK